MQTLSKQAFEHWLSEATVLEQDSHGPKVLRLADASLLKIFRSRQHPILAKLFPQACRFTKHANHLEKLGVHAPKVQEVFWIDPAQGISACRYTPLEGLTLEQLYHHKPEALKALIPELAHYILQLHRKGIYFRSLHLGNILHHPEQGFGLIDFLDIRFRFLPLGSWQVRRNFAHLKNYLQRRRMDQFPFEQLLKHYEQLRHS